MSVFYSLDYGPDSIISGTILASYNSILRDENVFARYQDTWTHRIISVCPKTRKMHTRSVPRTEVPAKCLVGISRSWLPSRRGRVAFLLTQTPPHHSFHSFTYCCRLRCHCTWESSENKKIPVINEIEGPPSIRKRCDNHATIYTTKVSIVKGA